MAPPARAALALALLALPGLGAGAGGEASGVHLQVVPNQAPADGEALAAFVVLRGTPGSVVEIRAWLEGPEVEGVQAWNGTVWSRADRYFAAGVFDGEGIQERWVAVRAQSVGEGAQLRVRARDGPGRILGEAAAPLGPANGSLFAGAAPEGAAAVGAWMDGRLLTLAPAHPFVATAPPWDLPGRVALRVPEGAELLAWLPDGRRDAAFTPAPAGPLRLDALLVDPRDDEAAEFVRVRNAGPEPVDLRGWDVDLGAARLVARGGVVAPGERAAFVRDAAAYERLTGRSDAVEATAEGRWTLPNPGGSATLGAWGAVVDEVRWGRDGTAPPDPGYLLRRHGEGWDGTWSAAWTERAPLAVAGPVAAFTTEDSYATLVGALGQAREEVLLEVYHFTHPALAGALHEALARGVAVRILVEAAPVGGMPSIEARLLGGLAAAGADVRTLGGSGADRYSTVHSKVLVLDRHRVLLGSENWTPSGFPVDGRGGNRGWGALLENAEAAAYFAEVWEDDADVTRGDVRPFPPGAADPPASEPPVTRSASAAPASVTAIVVPENALPAVLQLLGRATRQLDVQALQVPPVWADGPNPVLQALRQAAERGVRVRVLLDGAPGTENAATARLLEGWSAEGLPVEARLSQGVRVHNKAVVADGREALVSSINFGEAAMTRNREAGLVVAGAPVARWAAAFEADWTGSAAPVEAAADPLLVAVLCAGLACLGLGRAWRRRG